MHGAMTAPDSEWTPALVLRGLRLAFTDAPRLGENPTTFAFLADRAAAVLGPNSPECIALMPRTGGQGVGPSVREMCRARLYWHASRSELYRRSRNGAMRVAAALQRDGVVVPEALQTRGGRHSDTLQTRASTAGGR